MQAHEISFSGQSKDLVEERFLRIVLKERLEIRTTSELMFRITISPKNSDLESHKNIHLRVVPHNITQSNSTSEPPFSSSTGTADPVTIGVACSIASVVVLALVGYFLYLRSRQRKADLQRMLNLKKNPISPFGFAKNRWYSVENLSDNRQPLSMDEAIRATTSLAVSKKANLGDDDIEDSVLSGNDKWATKETTVDDLFALDDAEGTDDLVFLDDADDEDGPAIVKYLDAVKGVF